MNVLCNCGGRTPCIQRFCDGIPLVQARTDDVLAVADCIEEVRQAEAVELAELTAQWPMLVRAKFRKAIAALNEPGAALPPIPAAAAGAAPAAPTGGPDAGDGVGPRTGEVSRLEAREECADDSDLSGFLAALAALAAAAFRCRRRSNCRSRSG